MQVQPYLFFEGRTEEALEFYKKALGAKVEMLMRYKDSPEPQPPGMCTGKPNFQGITLSLDAANEREARRLFAALGEGGKVNLPLGKTFFSPAFGMVADCFGVSWMVIVAAPMPKAKE